MQGEEAAQAAAILEDGSKGKGLQFSDKDEHMYFWFPLLAGLSELTFDPRPDIRYSALEVTLITALPKRFCSLKTVFARWKSLLSCSMNCTCAGPI